MDEIDRSMDGRVSGLTSIQASKHPSIHPSINSSIHPSIHTVNPSWRKPAHCTALHSQPIDLNQLIRFEWSDPREHQNSVESAAALLFVEPCGKLQLLTPGRRGGARCHANYVAPYWVGCARRCARRSLGGDGHAVCGQREGVTRRRKATCPTPSAGVLRIWEGGEVEEGGVVWSGWVEVWRGQPNEGHVDKCMEANKQGSGKQHS